MHAGFSAACAAVIIAVPAALRIRVADAAETMKTHPPIQRAPDAKPDVVV